MILDTSFILDLWDAKPEAVDKAREVDARGEPTYIPTPVLFELWEGVARSRRPREEAAKIADFVAGQDLIPFGERDAQEAGLLSGRLARSGKMMGTIDVQIAGTAKARGETLLSSDQRFRNLSSEFHVEYIS